MPQACGCAAAIRSTSTTTATGHVNLILRGRPILIEAGTPSYDNKLMASHYSSGVGHNVLQVGSALPHNRVAPITVLRLDRTGGDVTVDATKCYDDVRQWRRRVRWSSSELSVTDDVMLADGKQDIILFRWHLGTAEEATITGDGKAFSVRWADAAMMLQGSAPLLVSQERLPDNTLESRGRDNESPDPLHTCIIVRSRDRVAGLRLTTQVVP